MFPAISALKFHPSNDSEQHKFSWMVIDGVDGGHEPTHLRKRRRLSLRKIPAYCGTIHYLGGILH